MLIRRELSCTDGWQLLFTRAFLFHAFSRSRVLGRTASNLLGAITHGSVSDISRSLPRFAFNFVPGLRRASARLSLEGDIHFIKRACAGHRDARRRKRKSGGEERREKKKKRDGKREKRGGKFKRERPGFTFPFSLLPFFFFARLPWLAPRILSSDG